MMNMAKFSGINYLKITCDEYRLAVITPLGNNINSCVKSWEGKVETGMVG